MGVSAATTASAAGVGQSAGAALDAQLAKCESQLADWVHCASAKTPEGKAKIEEFTARRDAIRARIQQREQAEEPRRDVNRSEPTTQRPASDPGRLLDVYA